MSISVKQLITKMELWTGALSCAGCTDLSGRSQTISDKISEFPQYCYKVHFIYCLASGSSVDVANALTVKKWECHKLPSGLALPNLQEKSAKEMTSGQRE